MRISWKDQIYNQAMQIHYLLISGETLVRNQGLQAYGAWESTYNHGHNILRLFDIWQNFPFTATKANCNY